MDVPPCASNVIIPHSSFGQGLVRMVLQILRTIPGISPPIPGGIRCNIVCEGVKIVIVFLYCIDNDRIKRQWGFFCTKRNKWQTLKAGISHPFLCEKKKGWLQHLVKKRVVWG